MFGLLKHQYIKLYSFYCVSLFIARMSPKARINLNLKCQIALKTAFIIEKCLTRVDMQLEDKDRNSDLYSRSMSSHFEVSRHTHSFVVYVTLKKIRITYWGKNIISLMQGRDQLKKGNCANYHLKALKYSQ